MSMLILCIGNRDGGDDAVGPYIADRLKSTTVDVIDCGTIPENYTGVVKKEKPDQLVIIAAVDMGLTPGEIRIIPKEKIGVTALSTHGIPISVLISYLEQYIKTIVFIGIQPKNMCGTMTETVKKSGEEVAKIIQKERWKDIEKLK